MMRRMKAAGAAVLAPLLLVVGTLLVAGVAAPGAAAAFALSSPDFKDGDYLENRHVYKGFGCSGENVSPALAWRDPPAGTKSFAVTVYDPDAPTGSGWWHWLVANLPAETRALPAGAGSGQGLPAGALQTRSDFGAPGYGGPCPPKGDHPHRYLFIVHALDVEKLDVPADAPGALVGFLLHAHDLGTAELMGLYKR